MARGAVLPQAPIRAARLTEGAEAFTQGGTAQGRWLWGAPFNLRCPRGGLGDPLEQLGRRRAAGSISMRDSRPRIRSRGDSL